MKIFTDSISWLLVSILCLTIGLAPYSPQPHIVEKIQLVMRGQLESYIDIFDFIFHASPFALLIFKLFYSLKSKK